MTSWPAARMGLYDRGVIREGLRADLTVFDLDRIAGAGPAAAQQRFQQLQPERRCRERLERAGGELQLIEQRTRKEAVVLTSESRPCPDRAGRLLSLCPSSS